MTPIAFLRQMLDAGMDMETALKAAEAFEAGLQQQRDHLVSVLQGRLEEVLHRLQTYLRTVPSDWRETRERIFARDGRVCRYCGDTEGPFHIDHIFPLRRGGSHDDHNLCVACAPCNLSKKDATVDEWRARR